jgi:hypothetical protein
MYMEALIEPCGLGLRGALSSFAHQEDVGNLQRPGQIS